jgi:hypothetical protein
MTLLRSKIAPSPPPRQTPTELRELQRRALATICLPLGPGGKSQTRWHEGRPLRVEYEKAFALAPQKHANFEGLNACLDQPLSAEQRSEKWGGLVDANPPQYQVWDGYAEFCLFLDQPEKYRKARTDLLRQFGNMTDPVTAQLVGRACLLFPGSEEETRMAVALIDRAMSSDPSSMDLHGYQPYFNVAKALGDYRQGKYQSAVDRLQWANVSVLGTMRQLILAMARHQLGEASEAKGY